VLTPSHVNLIIEESHGLENS